MDALIVSQFTCPMMRRTHYRSVSFSIFNQSLEITVPEKVG